VTDDDRPAWWVANDRLREKLGLAEYVPPRFEDGVYTHEVVPDLEADYGVEIRFLGVNASYGDDWEVRVDGESVLSIGRHRDDSGNTVYEMESDEFVAELSAALTDDAAD
jgi:hypothetical protein